MSCRSLAGSSLSAEVLNISLGNLACSECSQRPLSDCRSRAEHRHAAAIGYLIEGEGDLTDGLIPLQGFQAVWEG